MSATFFGGEIKYTKRYRLGQLLSTLTRHFLLMTATPHNGKEADFQLFMALLDGDRFEGRFRDGVHVADVSDLMRRMVKENLLKFDGTPLFPERIAYTVPYKLSDGEAHLYKAVTDYVREEFNRAEALRERQAGGHRRLRADHPAAPARLVARSDLPVAAPPPGAARKPAARAGAAAAGRRSRDRPRDRHAPALDAEDVEDLDEAPDNEVEAAEEQILDQATAARTIAELKAEIETLKQLEGAGARGPPQRHGHEVARAGEPACARSSRRRRSRSESRQTARRAMPTSPSAEAVAAPEARHLHRAPRHAELPRAAHHDAAGPDGGRRHASTAAWAAKSG